MIDQILNNESTSMLIGAVLGLIGAVAFVVFGIWACNRIGSRLERRQLRRVAQMRHRLDAANGDDRWSA